jgi:hypothetical protein
MKVDRSMDFSIIPRAELKALTCVRHLNLVGDLKYKSMIHKLTLVNISRSVSMGNILVSLGKGCSYAT